MLDLKINFCREKWAAFLTVCPKNYLFFGTNKPRYCNENYPFFVTYFAIIYRNSSRKNFIPVFCTKQAKTPFAIKWMSSIDFIALYFLEFATVIWRNIYRFSPKPSLCNRPASHKIHT